ncbi:MAG: NAD-dependent succinate-semialdehyde dehydrogenase [Planctomycetota bacterium]|nr:MAG: NAD-dependent succinate-semialdehyde dehydrogenase [Planctomycetota bacterium]
MSERWNPQSVQPIWVNNEWVTGEGELPVVDPSTGEVFARVATVGRSVVQSAIGTAFRAWDAWRRLTGRERGRCLLRIADAVDRRADEFARTITRENGKPLAQARAEVAMTVDHLQWFAEEARRAYGRVVPQQVAGKRHLVLRQPVGVVGAIAPWNFPLVLAVRKAAPALAAGCPVVLKPASATPLSAVLLCEAIEAADLPPGVFHLVVGTAAEIGAEFTQNPLCRKITFTGSTAVGRELMRAAGEQIKKLSLELGGHAPAIVFEDADLEIALQQSLIAKFRNTGQSCIAANRLYVQRSIFGTFVDAFVERTKALKVGGGFEPDVEIGPLIDAAAVEHALAQVEDAVAQGAQIACGGRRLDRPGFFFEPTVLTDVPRHAQCMTEESFAPLVPIVPFDTEEEVIAAANDTEYGLAAYLFTQRLDRAWRVAEALEAGTVAVNDGVPAVSCCPFGGFKQSGMGRELGTEGLDAFLETKHVSLGNIG